MPAKSPVTIECGCAKKCFSHIPEDRRRALYVGFWNTADFNVQNTYLCGCIKVSQVKRRYTEKAKDSQRGYSREYYVNNGNESVKVCKAAFRSIFAVSDGRINRALKAQSEASGAPHTDRRGHHEPKNKISDQRKGFVREHIESFPKYRSHYSRKDNPNRSYLSPTLSIAKMFELYRIKCSEAEVEPVSEWVYRRIFNTEYNLCFGRYGKKVLFMHIFL